MVAPWASLRVAASGLTDTSKAISLNLWISQPVWCFAVSHILLGDNICFPFPPFTCSDCKCSVSSIRTWPTQQDNSQPAQSQLVSEADQSHLTPSHHERYINSWWKRGACSVPWGDWTTPVCASGETRTGSYCLRVVTQAVCVCPSVVSQLLKCY